MPRRFNPKGKMTKAQRAWLIEVKSLPCVKCSPEFYEGEVICDLFINPVSEAHHLVECGRRLGHDWIIPLCKPHHDGINATPFQEQLELCRKVYRKMGGIMDEPTSKVVKRKV